MPSWPDALGPGALGPDADAPLPGLGYQQQQHAFPYNLVSDNDIFLSLLGPYHQPGPSLADDFLTTGVDPVYSDELNHTSFALASRDRPAAPDRPPAPSLDFDFASHHHNNLHTPLHPFSYRPPDLVATTHIPTAFDNPHWAPLPPSIPRTALQNEVEPTGQAERRLRDELLLLGSATQVPTNGAILFPPPNMPAAASRKRSRAASCIDDRTGPSAGSNKRKTNTVGHRPTNAARAPSTVVNLAEWSDSDDLFGPDAQVYDLTNDDVQPGELVVHNNPKKEEEEDNRVRLAKFECIICMDNASNLTVTHCGHMFCAQCLHQAIHTEVTKKICPMCRQKLDVRPRNGVAPSKNAKTFFHLELKLMPSKRQGKQRAR